MCIKEICRIIPRSRYCSAMCATHQIHIFYADCAHNAVSVKIKSDVVGGGKTLSAEKARFISVLTHIDFLIWWKQTLVFALRLLLEWKRKRNHSYSGKYTLCDRHPNYWINADWLYLTCSNSKSQIAKLMSGRTHWNLRRMGPINVQHRMTRMLVCLLGRMCASSALVFFLK